MFKANLQNVLESKGSRLQFKSESVLNLGKILPGL